MSDCRFDRDGNRIENPVPGNPNPNPDAPSDEELRLIRRNKQYAWHRNAGSLEVWYDQNDAAHQLPQKSASRGGR